MTYSQTSHTEVWGLLMALGIIMIFFGLWLYDTFYMGDFIVKEQWINSSYQGLRMCDNCLFIRFYEGCNLYPVFYFENQHEFDNRFNNGDAVNIIFQGHYIRGIIKATKYRNKC